MFIYGQLAKHQEMFVKMTFPLPLQDLNGSLFKPLSSKGLFLHIVCIALGLNQDIQKKKIQSNEQQTAKCSFGSESTHLK